MSLEYILLNPLILQLCKQWDFFSKSINLSTIDTSA